MTKTLGKSVLFKCGRCVGLITISEPSFLVIYEGHFYCLRCRKAGGYKCASQHGKGSAHRGDTGWDLPIFSFCYNQTKPS